jgi:hypothetical protein
MKITWKHLAYDFNPWRPEHGRVLRRTFAFDTETTLIDKTRPWVVPAYVIGAAFDGTTGVFVTRDNLAAFFSAHDGLAIAAHHASFDVRVIRTAAPDLDIDRWVDRRKVWCTRLLYQLLALGTAGHVAEGKGRTTLARLTRRLLGVKLPKDVIDSDGRQIRVSYGKWLGRRPAEIEPVYLEYLARDVIATRKLYARLRRRLRAVLDRAADAWGFVSAEWLRDRQRRWGPQTHHIQLRAAVALQEVTANGLHRDPDRVGRLNETVAAERDRLRGELARHGYLPGEGSTKALQAILARVERGRPDHPLPRTPSGRFATGAAALRDLVAEVPFAATLNRYQAADKLLTTFVEKLDRPVLHASFRPLVRSGRTSSYGEINAQNLPRDDRVRNCFVPSPGHTFVDADFRTIELVTLAHACAAQFGLESRMAEAIKVGRDLHTVVAARVTGKAEADVMREERQRAKVINFGKPGGMGLSTLRSYAKDGYGVDLSEADAAALSDAWLAEFPEMRAFLDDEGPVPDRVAGLLGLSLAAHAAATGDARFTWRATAEGRLDRSDPVLGAMLLKAIGRPDPCKRTGEPYRAADVEYFWDRVAAVADRLPARAREAVARRDPGPELRRAVVALADRRGVFTLTGRLRARATYCQRRNTVFQGLAADGAKLALWKLFRAGYRVVNFIHDEFLIEVPVGDDVDRHVRRIERLMKKGMRAVVPDLPVGVEATVGPRWGKSGSGAAAGAAQSAGLSSAVQAAIASAAEPVGTGSA